MPSHTISVHFRCPLLLFLLSFSCPICPHLSTLIFGCLHPDMPPRSMPQPVPRRPPSQSDTAHRCSLLPQNAGKIRFHRTVNHDILAIRFQPKQQTFGGCAVFRKENPITGNRFSPHLQRGNPAILAKHRLRFSFL